MAGLIEGVRVVELASEGAAFAGKLLAGMGAEVVVVEPPGGHHTRTFGPFADDVPHPEGSLWWRHYNMGKQGVTIDLDVDAAAFRELALGADIVLEAEPPGRLAELGIDVEAVRELAPDLIWVSVTPVGHDTPGATDPFVDLTVQARGGPAWSCGYDDHSLPPVRGGGNQGLQTASVFAVLGALTALVHRDAGGPGQHIDVSAHAATNVSTEIATVSWLLSGDTVQRQTGRHAMTQPTMEVQVQAGDGRWVTTGFAPHSADDYRNLLEWMDSLGIRDEFPEAFFLELGVERGGVDPRSLDGDAEGMAIFGAGRDALVFIASRIGAYDFFVGSQQRDMQCGIVFTPEEALADVHFRERGFPVEVHHDDLGRSFTYPGVPVAFRGTPGQVTRAPRIGEHDDEVFHA